MKMIIKLSKMEQYRVDYVPIEKPSVNQGGILSGTGVLARAGCQTYLDKDGKEIVEFRPPSEVRKSKSTFSSLAVTLEHPEVPITEANVEQYTVGITGETSYLERDKVIRGQIKIFNNKAKEFARRTHKYLSCGYTCDIEENPGEWTDEFGIQGPPGKKYRYDCIQRNIEGNHLALVQNPRAGEKARFDSGGREIKYDNSNMNILNLNKTEGDFMGEQIQIRIDGSDVELNCPSSEIAEKARKALEMGEKIQSLNVKYDESNIVNLLELGNVAVSNGLNTSKKIKDFKDDSEREKQNRVDIERQLQTLKDENKQLKENQSNFDEKLKEGTQELFDSVLSEYSSAYPYLPENFKLEPGIKPGDMYKLAIKTHLPKVDIREDVDEDMLKFQFQMLQSVKPPETLNKSDEENSEESKDENTKQDEKMKQKDEDNKKAQQDYEKAQERLNEAHKGGDYLSDYKVSLPQQRATSMSVQ